MRESLRRGSGTPLAIQDKLELLGGIRLPTNASGETLKFFDPIEFGNTVTFAYTPERKILVVPKATAIPGVFNTERLQMQNTIATNITYFKDGSEGQTIIILGDGFSTLVNSATIKNNTGANKLLLANRTYQYTLFNKVWIET